MIRMFNLGCYTKVRNKFCIEIIMFSGISLSGGDGGNISLVSLLLFCVVFPENSFIFVRAKPILK